jgi:ATP-binding cassette subfamily C protein LapB
MTNTVAFPSITGAIMRKVPGTVNEPTSPEARTRIKVKPGETPPARPDGLSRLMRRAELLAVYAKQLGATPVVRDIYDALHARTAGESVNADDLAEGLRATGLGATSDRQAIPDRFPLIAMMVNGQAVLVLDRVDETLVIYEPGAPDGRTEVAVSDFAPFYAGVVVRAVADPRTLDARHTEAKAAPHWFWGELKRYKRHFADVALGSFVANLLAVSVALFSLQVYDRVIPHQSVPTLWMLALGAGFAILMEAAIKVARARLMDGAGRSIELNVQKLLLGRLLAMRSDKRPTTPSGLFAAMREFSSVREFFTASSIGALTDIPFIFVFLLLVSSIGGSIVWVLLAGGILMILPGLFLQKRMVELSRQSQGASAKTSRLLHEAIYDLDTIKSARGEARFSRLWDELITLQALKSTEQRKLSALLTFWAQGVQQATYVGAVIAGTYLVFAGEFTVGTIIAVGILSGRTLAPLTQLAATLARWSNVRNALEGLDAIAGAEQEEADGRTLLRRDVIHGSYELREVRFAYDEDMPSLDVAGLAIEHGQHVAVLGANGSGKSTFLKLLAGLYAPVSGRILVDGVDLGQIAPRDLRRNLGYLGQDVRLFAGSLRDNLDLTMLERDDERLLAALDFAGLGPFVRGHAKGLDLEIRDNGEGLSAGQRQSIGWARLWLQDPRIVVLDEPTAALDTTLEATLVSRLSTWLEGRTAIIATHRVPILNLTERTVILQNGRLAVDGPRDEVLAHLREVQAKREAG